MYTTYFFKYVVSNMLFDPDNPRNQLLQIEVIFNIGSTIYITRTGPGYARIFYLNINYNHIFMLF